MDNEQPNAEIVEQSTALSTDSAAAMLSRSMNAQPRNSGGQFAAKETAETVVEEAGSPATEEPAKVIDLKTGKPAEVEKAAAEETAEEEDYFEFPAEEEGKEPRRVKLDEVLAAYEELPKIRAELETAKKPSGVPTDYLTALKETVEARSKYMKGLEFVQGLMSPSDPSMDLLNPAHPKYDPDAYYQQKTAADQARQRLDGLKAAQKEAQKQQDEEESILARAQLAREVEAISKAWPEFANVETRKGVSESLAKTYGFTADEINNIADHRQFLVIRDALELRALKAKQAEAVKVVRAKPKLVKGAARSTTTPKATAHSNAMAALQQTGSMQAAAAALKGLL